MVGVEGQPFNDSKRQPELLGAQALTVECTSFNHLYCVSPNAQTKCRSKRSMIDRKIAVFEGIIIHLPCTRDATSSFLREAKAGILGSEGRNIWA